jgi:hypothetical protein
VKTILTASIASLLLVAGVAAAQSDSAIVRVGDRLGSSSDASNDLQGSNSTPLLLLGGGLALALIIGLAAGGHGGGNSNSVSP